jgi:hypothetical protein
MSTLIKNRPTRDLFGVFPIDGNGSVADHIGGWHHTLEQAEQHLGRVTEQNDRSYVVLSSAEFETRMTAQGDAQIVFKTGHDLLMEKFDAWLKAKSLIRGVKAAAKLGLSDKEFKSVTKRGLVKGKNMPGHADLVGFPADLSFTNEQHHQVLNEITLNAQEVAEALKLTQKEFNGIRQQFDIMHSVKILGRTVLSDSASGLLYSRADIEKLRSAIDKTVIKGA